MSDRKAIPLLLILCTGVLFLIFGDVILHPNEYMFGIIGDGIKNYFTFAYYVKFDSGLHFSGMNHPWGEHIVYTDNQPFFSVPLGFIHRNIVALDQSIIGIINSIVFASMVASSVVLYFILRKCLLPAWFAVIGAILVMLLSSQHFMISLQYALTNNLAIPSIWLAVILLFLQPFKLKRHVLFVLVTLATGFIHPYFLPIGFLLFIGYWLWFVVQQWQKRTLHQGIIAVLFFSGVMPLILFKAILFFTDNITDRPETPKGFLEGKSTLAGLLYPIRSLIATLLEFVFQKHVPPFANQGYIGLAALFCLLLAGLKAARYLLKKDVRKVVKPVLPVVLQMGIWSGFLVVIFSAAVPFRFGLMHWLDYIAPLKQFRVISRFAWVFYYVFAVFGVFMIYQVYRYLKIRKKQILAYVWLSVMVVVWLIDAMMLLQIEVKLISENKVAAEFMGTTDEASDMWKKIARNPDDYQMIVPVPYFSAGSEKIGYSNWKSGSMFHSLKASYQTGLPLSTGEMARTSLNQSLLRTQLLSSDSIKKVMLPLLHHTKPILIIVTDSAEKDYEKQLVAKSKFLAKAKNVSYYELPINQLQQVYEEAGASEKITGIPADVVYETYPKNSSNKWLFNKGAFFSETGPAILFDALLPQAKANLPYQASVWLNGSTLVGRASIWLEETDNQNQVVQKLLYEFRDATEIYQDWLRATLYFKLQNPDNKIRITVIGKGIVADELLIRPVSQPVYFYTEDRNHVIRNNYLLP